jgi:hypothetical protein
LIHCKYSLLLRFNLLTFHSQHFQKIRRDFRGDSPAKPRANKVTKSITSAPRKDSKASKSFTSDSGTLGTNGSFTLGNDGEFGDSPSSLKRKRMMKVEEDQENGQTAPLFKLEHDGHHPIIDLEQDE